MKTSGLSKLRSVSKAAAILLLVLGLAGAAAAGSGRSPVASVRVDGMVCYSCSYGMEKSCKLWKLGKSYAMDLENGLFKITLAPDEAVPSPQDFRRMVQDAGFTYRGVTLEVDGKIVVKDGRYSVLLPSSGQVLGIEKGPKLSTRQVDVAKIHRLSLKAGEEKKQKGWELASLAPVEEARR